MNNMGYYVISLTYLADESTFDIICFDNEILVKMTSGNSNKIFYFNIVCKLGVFVQKFSS